MPRTQTPQRTQPAPRTVDTPARRKSTGSTDSTDAHKKTSSPERKPPGDRQPQPGIDTAGRQHDDRAIDVDIDTLDPGVEGEGSYTAARRHRDSVETFVEAGRVDKAARKAAPDSPDEADELRRAEEEGRRHAKT